MAAQNYDTSESILVGIDISKDFSEAVVQLPNGKNRSFRFMHRACDMEGVISSLKTYQRPVVVGLEATGDYHRVVAHQFHEAGFTVVLISSLAACRYREAAHGTIDKNDCKDSSVILRMMKEGLVQHYHEPIYSHTHSLREVAGMYHHVVNARTKGQHQLQNHFLALYFPELQSYWKSTRALWMVELLKVFPTPWHIRQVSCEEFVEKCASFYKRAKSVKLSKFEEIYELAQGSLGLPVEEDLTALDIFRMHLEELSYLEKRRRLLEERSQVLLETHHDFAVLTSLPGIGTIHALTILAEAGDLRRFSHHRQFLKYCGFDLSKQQSGKHIGSEVLSKRGNALLRRTFWMAACSAVRQPENSFHEKYKRYTTKDPKNKDLIRKALTAVAAKIARVAYSLVKNNSQYRPCHELRLPSGMTSLCVNHRGNI